MTGDRVALSAPLIVVVAAAAVHSVLAGNLTTANWLQGCCSYLAVAVVIAAALGVDLVAVAGIVLVVVGWAPMNHFQLCLVINILQLKLAVNLHWTYDARALSPRKLPDCGCC